MTSDDTPDLTPLRDAALPSGTPGAWVRDAIDATVPAPPLPSDVAQAKALIGMYLLSLPEPERHAAMLAITQTLAAHIAEPDQ